ncbi:GNAT family N-acetyltransferase [Flavobacterium humi]|uniref:GNAT family N-acetyltransferase n=1 Tax=Flavobacterium humi TaxID=2562683 RepID=A0A4Z0L8L9_9FLAO|nr:GNAT family N-acetyltransferase [Flavobacterium humi]TGD57955.1 GNAT family N-acetyltransferase [Flavobacterium humi]
MIRCTRTDSEDNDFQKLVEQLDAELRLLDGEEHAFLGQLNKTGALKHCIVAYENQVPVGCGALREYSAGVMEVKRMYVPEDHRGKRIASAILTALEVWAKELDYTKCVLETGNKQLAAMALYHKSGYHIIANFGKYQGLATSVCFEKTLAV